MANDPYYKKCCRAGDGTCGGRITWEHVIIFASKQLNERWCIIPLCERHHAVNNYQDNGDLNKRKNIWIALNRATDQELLSISKAVNYIQQREYYNTVFGKYGK